MPRKRRSPRICPQYHFWSGQAEHGQKFMVDNAQPTLNACSEYFKTPYISPTNYSVGRSDVGMPDTAPRERLNAMTKTRRGAVMVTNMKHERDQRPRLFVPPTSQPEDHFCFFYLVRCEYLVAARRLIIMVQAPYSTECIDVCT